MAVTLFEAGGGKEEKKKKSYSIVTGFVTNNCDLIMHGKVLVRIPTVDQEVWARLAAAGAGKGKGLYMCPDMNDEVLLALNDNEPTDAYIIGNLWNTQNGPPVSDPLTATTKRKLKTGLVAGVGHEVEFDDGPGQSITITTATQQKITLEPKKIEISAGLGTAKITLNLTPPSVSIEAVANVEVKSQGNLTLSGKNINIGDALTAKVTIQGGMVFIN